MQESVVVCKVITKSTSNYVIKEASVYFMIPSPTLGLYCEDLSAMHFKGRRGKRLMLYNIQNRFMRTVIDIICTCSQKTLPITSWSEVGNGNPIT